MVTYKLNVGEEHILASNNIRELDEYTIGFQDEEELLNELGISGKLKISYIFKEQKELKIAYADKKKILNVKINENNKIDITNQIFLQYISSFIRRLQDHHFYTFVINSTDLSAKAKEYISLIFGSKIPNNFHIEQLKKHLDTYLDFRKILFLLEEYDQIQQERDRKIAVEKQTETVDIPPVINEDDENDDHQEEFYTDGDRKYYNDYMNEQNIPVSDLTKGNSLKYNRWKI